MYHDRVLAVPSAMIANPHFPTPPEIAKGLVLLEIQHFNFAGIIKTGHIIVHQLVLPDVRQFFSLAFRLRFPIHSVRTVNEFGWDEIATNLANNSSGQNMRNIVGTTGLLNKLSKHAIGCAFDINPVQNPYYVLDEQTLELQQVIPSNARYVPGSPGTLHNGHPLVRLMIERGWAWGGNWTFPVDYQHFQIVPPELASWVK